MSRIHFSFRLTRFASPPAARRKPPHPHPHSQFPPRPQRSIAASRSWCRAPVPTYPQDYNVAIGARKPSNIGGYDSLPVTLSRGEKSTLVDFLITTTDNTKLARLETFDLAKDPRLLHRRCRPSRSRQSHGQGHGHQLRRPRMPLLRAHASYRSSQDTLGPLQEPESPLSTRMTHSNSFTPGPCMPPSTPIASPRRAPMSIGPMSSYLHDHGQEISGPDRDKGKSFAALDRVARQEATLGKLDSEQSSMPASPSRMRPQVRCIGPRGRCSTEDRSGTPALFVYGERVDGAVPEEQIWLVIDRALRASGEQPPPAPPPAAPARFAPWPPAPPRPRHTRK